MSSSPKSSLPWNSTKVTGSVPTFWMRCAALFDVDAACVWVLSVALGRAARVGLVESPNGSVADSSTISAATPEASRDARHPSMSAN